MSWSLGEVASLSAKAAKGAGHPWGVAEEVGWAIRWLAARGLPAAETCAHWLDDAKGTCPVALGLGTLSDYDGAGTLEFSDVKAPLLSVPFLARALGDRCAAVVSLDSEALMVSATCIQGTCRAPHAKVMTVAPSAQEMSPIAAVNRVESISPEALDALSEFAARTYAPASEASRLSGAGAGLTDND